MAKYGWHPKDLQLVLKRAERAGFNPYSEDEYAVARYIESLPGCGYIEKEINGRVGRFYCPRGY